MTGGLLDDGKGESMITLAGTLEGIGLPALLRFLSTLRPDGRLLVADDVWGGEVAFDQGEVVAATFGAEHGLAALEAIALALPNGDFRFTGGPPPGGRDIDVPAAEFEAYLTSLSESQAFMARVLPSLVAVPQLVDPGAVSLPAGQEQVTIDRSTLYTLLLVDGQRSAHGICEWRSGQGAGQAAGRGAGGSQPRQGRGTQGIAQTLKELAWLAEAGLVTIEAPRQTPSPPGSGQERTPAASPAAGGDLSAARVERTRNQPPPDRLSESLLPVNRPLSAGGGAEGGRSGLGTAGDGSRAPASRPPAPTAGEAPLEGAPALPADASATPVVDAPPADTPAPSRARGLLPWLRFSAVPALAPAWPGRALFPAPAPDDRAPQRGDSGGGSGGVTLAGTEADAVEGSEAALRYWRRTVILAVLAVMLLILSWLQQNGWSGAWPPSNPTLNEGRQVTTTLQP